MNENPSAPTQDQKSNRGWRRAVLFGVPTVAAAAVGFLFWRRKSLERTPAPALARTASAGGGEESSNEAQPLIFLVGATADITARPRSLKGPVTAAAYWVRDNETLPWDAQVDLSADGVIHVRGTITAPWGGVEDDLAIVITPPGVTPPLPAACKPPCEVIVKRVRYIRSIAPLIPPADAR